LGGAGLAIGRMVARARGHVRPRARRCRAGPARGSRRTRPPWRWLRQGCGRCPRRPATDPGAGGLEGGGTTPAAASLASPCLAAHPARAGRLTRVPHGAATGGDPARAGRPPAATGTLEHRGVARVAHPLADQVSQRDASHQPQQARIVAEFWTARPGVPCSLTMGSGRGRRSDQRGGGTCACRARPRPAAETARAGPGGWTQPDG
jgi:hypothetical protein